jgi:very-short-patch-repair endonuclease
MMALGQGAGGAGGGGGGGMPPMPGGDMGGGGGMPPAPGGDMGGAPGSTPSGAPGGDMGGGAPIAPPAGGAPTTAMATEKISLSSQVANPQNYGGKILTQRTREKMDSEKQKLYRAQTKKKEEEPGLTGMRDAKGRIVFTKPERDLLTKIGEYKTNGLIRYPVIPQFPVKFGSIEYPIDFALPNLKIGIEADGEAFHSSPKQITHDRERDMKLAQAGWTILRFQDTEIDKRIERVMNTILKTIMQKEMAIQNQAPK